MSDTLEHRTAILFSLIWLWICNFIFLYPSSLWLAMHIVSYSRLQKRLSLPTLFDGAITHVKSALQFPLTTAATAAAIAAPEMSFRTLSSRKLRRDTRSETPASSHDRTQQATPTQINLYPIDGSPEDKAVESDMIDIGFYASIGYPVNRNLALDGGSDIPSGQESGHVSTPRHKAQNRNATVGVMPTPPMTNGIGPKTLLVSVRSIL